MASFVDPTEGIRRAAVEEINSNATNRADLERVYGAGNVWDTAQLQEQFEVIGFMAPFVVVIRKSDRQKGSLTFQHLPRFYFDWMPDRG